MSGATRAREFRKRQKSEGMVDIRTEIPTRLRDNLKHCADANGTTMKEEFRLAIEERVEKLFG